jgi:hypothetical protein
MTFLPDPRRPHDELEKFVHRTLRDLPARRAPHSLEQRVLAELSRRAALPWWHKSFIHWPVPARAAFFVVSLAVVKLMLMATVWAMVGFDLAAVQSAFAQPIAWWEGGRAVLTATTGFVEVMLRNIPSLLLYGGLAFVAMVYAALFGLGAAAYKALRAQP